MTQQQVDTAALVGSNRALARVGQDYALAIQQAEIWQQRALEAGAKYDSAMKVLEANDIDLASLMALAAQESDDTAAGVDEDADSGGDGGGYADANVVAETEEGDDGAAAP